MPWNYYSGCSVFSFGVAAHAMELLEMTEASGQAVQKVGTHPIVGLSCTCLPNRSKSGTMFAASPYLTV